MGGGLWRGVISSSFLPFIFNQSVLFCFVDFVLILYHKKIFGCVLPGRVTAPKSNNQTMLYDYAYRSPPVSFITKTTLNYRRQIIWFRPQMESIYNLIAANLIMWPILQHHFLFKFMHSNLFWHAFIKSVTFICLWY